MKQTIRAPFANGETEQVSNRVFRKQILKFGEIDYKGRRFINFDKKYVDDVITAFRDGAFDTVPFVLADTNNKHTKDPERARGEILDLEATEHGLDAIIKVDNPETAKLIDNNPKFGVSVSVREEFQRADGKNYDRALAHVLGTFEPIVTGMSPWQSVDASVEDEKVVDLTTVNLSGTEKENEMPQKKRSEEEQEALFSRLEQFLAQMESDSDDTEDEEEVEEQGEAAETEDELTDEELQELRDFLAEIDAKTTDKETVDASAEEDDDKTVELSMALQAQEKEIRQLRKENNRRAYEAEKQDWVRMGIPPVVLDLAQPLLQGRNVVELSDTGKSVDAGDIMRKVFEALGKHGLVSMDEYGNSVSLSQEDEEAVEERIQKIHALRRDMGLTPRKA